MSGLTNMDRAAIRWYVKESTRNIPRNKNGNPLNSISVGHRISAILDNQEPLQAPTVVWRGHTGDSSHISSLTWFSTTPSQQSARIFMNQNAGCCLFKIHLMPGIRVLNIAKALQNSPNRKTRKNNRLHTILQEEQEWIVQGGGVFYKDRTKSEQGFVNKGDYYEAYYYPAAKELSANEIVALLMPEEYNFVFNTNYFVKHVLPTNTTASPSSLAKALEKVQTLKGM